MSVKTANRARANGIGATSLWLEVTRRDHRPRASAAASPAAGPWPVAGRCCGPSRNARAVLSARLFAGDGAVADVAAEEGAVPRDLANTGVGRGTRGLYGVAGADDAKHTAAVGDDAASFEARARVEDFHVLARDAIEARDGLALLVRVGIAAARHDDADGGARVPAERLVAERALEAL